MGKRSFSERHKQNALKENNSYQNVRNSFFHSKKKNYINDNRQQNNTFVNYIRCDEMMNIANSIQKKKQSKLKNITEKNIK